MLLRIYKGCCNFFLTSCCKLNHRKYAHAHSSNSAACRRISYTLSNVRVALATSDVQSYLDIPATDEIHTGLEIKAGQRTMSELIVDLTGQTLVLSVILTGQNSMVLKMK